MYIFGKLLGAAFGSLIAGPIGVLIGVFVGHLFDKGLRLNAQMASPDVGIAKEVFFKTTFMVMGYIAKADGRVSESEIHTAREVMSRLGLSGEERQSAMHYFSMGKSSTLDYEAIVDNFIRNCAHHPQLIQLFIEIQLQAALVDGIDNPQKRFAIEYLCDRLNIPRVVLAQMGARYRAEQTFHQPRRTPRDELTSAYAILGVTPEATQAVVKKAYKQRMSQNHPDKLVAKGLPAEMIRVATEKTQHIQKAYEIICRARAMS